MLQSTDPKKLSNKDASRDSHESSWEGKIEQTSQVDRWNRVGGENRRDQVEQG